MWKWEMFCRERGTGTYCGWEYTYTPINAQKIPENFSAMPIVIIGLIIILFIKGRNK